jgi:hypothetical protein
MTEQPEPTQALDMAKVLADQDVDPTPTKAEGEDAPESEAAQ